MLKINYTDGGLFIEQVNGTLETAIAQRTLLNVRAGRALYAEAGIATVLISADVPMLALLQAALAVPEVDQAVLYPADTDTVEICLKGVWLAESTHAHEGVFMMQTEATIEALIYQAWVASQPALSSLA